jgi:CRISPR type IV-associated protein Csf1
MASVAFPSALYRKATGLPVDAERAPHVAAVDANCAMCGAPVAAGERCLLTGKDTFTGSFNNRLDLAFPSSPAVCADCATLWQKDFLQRYSKTVANRHGVYKLASNEDHAQFVLDPPEPPFVAILSTTQQQHLIWRTPVTLSKELLFVRLGDEVLSIRPQLVRQALKDYDALVGLMAAHKLKGLPCTFDRDLASERVGSIRSDVRRLALANGLADEVERLVSLTMGDWWALNAVRQFSGADKVPPKPLTRVLPAPEAA